MAKKEEKKEFDGRIWPNLLDFNVNIDSQLTSKANFLFGACMLVLMFIVSKIFSAGFSALDIFVRLSWYVLLVGSFIAALLSMMVVLPKLRIFSKKLRVKDDIFYYKNIKKYYMREDYCSYLRNLPSDNERISKAYANQIYSLATNIIPYKFKMLKISGWTFIITVVAGIIVGLIGHLK
jgi:4-amino-4-deoxy-L-arabinose transferase-like glycosyltransferase